MKHTSIKIHPLPKGSEPLKKEVGQLAVDIYKTPDELVILAPIAGVEKENLHLSITDDVLVIKGERELAAEIEEDAYYTKECFWGNFSRAIVLPLEADTSKIQASFEKNILEIHIPLTEKEKTKIIKIAA